MSLLVMKLFCVKTRFSLIFSRNLCRLWIETNHSDHWAWICNTFILYKYIFELLLYGVFSNHLPLTFWTLRFLSFLLPPLNLASLRSNAVSVCNHKQHTKDPDKLVASMAFPIMAERCWVSRISMALPSRGTGGNAHPTQHPPGYHSPLFVLPPSKTTSGSLSFKVCDDNPCMILHKKYIDTVLFWFVTFFPSYLYPVIEYRCPEDCCHLVLPLLQFLHCCFSDLDEELDLICLFCSVLERKYFDVLSLELGLCSTH